jgi:hypothetical protein
MTRMDKLTQIAQQERVEVELEAAHARLMAAHAVLVQYNEDHAAMATCIIAQIQALQKEVSQ